MSTLQVEGTLLVLSSMGIPLYSARGLTQTLVPIDAAGQQRRTINGVKDDLSQEQFQKYQSTISCADMNSPAIDGVFPGMIVDIDCIYELSYRTVGGSPSRPVVSGSSRVVGAFTVYCPKITAMVSPGSPKVQKDEWGGVVTWSIDFEEV